MLSFDDPTKNAAIGLPLRADVMGPLNCNLGFLKSVHNAVLVSYQTCGVLAGPLGYNGTIVIDE
jgi:hypothetical protein